MELNQEFLSQTQALIEEKQLRWKPQVLRSRSLSATLPRYALGYIPKPTEPSETEIEQRATEKFANYRALRQDRPRLLPHFSRGAPVRWDWRNVEGRNFIGPVTNQKQCGSCVAFATANVIQANSRIFRDIAVDEVSDLSLDLSEAHLHFCGARTDCDGGWNLPDAMSFSSRVGVTHESFFPYSDKATRCQLKEGWEKSITQLNRYRRLNSVYEMKAWIAEKGPLLARFNVYDDFFAYESGVYEHVNGDFAGGHAACVIGFDEEKEAWLCKNSWGENWGENGYYWMGYGQCGIDASMYAIHSFYKIDGMPVRPFAIWYEETNFQGPGHLLNLSEEARGTCLSLPKANAMKSIKFFASPDWKLSLYDRPNCSESKDWAEITFPDDPELRAVEIADLDDPATASPISAYQLHRKDGLTGKVSAFKVIKEGTYATLDWWTRKHFRGRHYQQKLLVHEAGKCLELERDNRLRSFKLQAPAGWRLELYDHPDCNKAMDWAECRVEGEYQTVEVPEVDKAGEETSLPKGQFTFHDKVRSKGRISSIKFFTP